MGVVVESSVWEPNPAPYIFIFPYASCNSSNKTLSLSDHGFSPSFRCFQRNFLFLSSLASAMEGLRSVFGEFVFAHYGVSKEQMIVSLFLGSAASLFVGSFFGVLSDLICIEHTLPRPCLEMYFGVSIVSKEETPGGYYWNIGNAVIMAFAALGLLTAAGSMHVLK